MLSSVVDRYLELTWLYENLLTPDALSATCTLISLWRPSGKDRFFSSAFRQKKFGKNDFEIENRFLRRLKEDTLHDETEVMNSI